MTEDPKDTREGPKQPPLEPTPENLPEGEEFAIRSLTRNLTPEEMQQLIDEATRKTEEQGDSSGRRK